MAELQGDEGQLPADIKDWSTEHVRRWTLMIKQEKCANILYEKQINGECLLILKRLELEELGIPFGPAILIINKRDELVERKEDILNNPEVQAGGPCKPYPFNRFHEAYRYILNSCLDIPESGALDLIEPCHEFKGFIKAAKRPQEEKMEKFTKEVKRFAAACMNSRTNGTIHFGVGDQQEGFKHGQILGFSVEDKESFGNALHNMIDRHFEPEHVDAAKKCIKPPRFVEVLQPNMASSETYVVEVDIEPTFSVCAENLYHVFGVAKTRSQRSKGKDHKGDAKEGQCFYIRDNSSTRDLLLTNTQFKPLEEYDRYKRNLENLARQRKEAEAKRLAAVKKSTHGSQLCEMITGGSHSLDVSRFERYILVTNKSHPVQLDSLSFLKDMNLTAVLDFDPESSEKGLQKFFQDRSTNIHSPAQYRITEAVEDIAIKLKLTRITSWVFCNGGINKEEPSDMKSWSTEKGASVRDVVSFLCRGEVLPHERFLVIFLLLSDVTNNKDPLLETFNTFRQELRGLEQILCICENSRSFISWKQLIKAQYGEKITHRCISELSFAEISGTVLSLWSANRLSIRFLTCGGGSKVQLPKKLEGDLDTLDILCVNQCEGGNESNKLSIQENFYKGGKVSWWNFYFSEQPGSKPFIKRDKFDYITGTIIPDLCSLTKPCVVCNIIHLPGCGGTTLGMHILWTHKQDFRCAVLKDRTADPDEVAKQVVELLSCTAHQQATRASVLLMTDDLEENYAVYILQQCIEKQLSETRVATIGPQVIILNCMRSEVGHQHDTAVSHVLIGNELSLLEQKLFQNKLQEIEETHENPDTFYGFMILKNFSEDYIKGVAINTLKSFDFNNKEDQLIAVMVFLNVYCESAPLSVSLCAAFLGFPNKKTAVSCKVRGLFKKYSTLVANCSVQDKVVFEAVKIIHPSMAKHCLEELTTSHKISKADITDRVLSTEGLYDCQQGRAHLLQNVRTMLVKRRSTMEAEVTMFSPLIQAIMKDSPWAVERVLQRAAEIFKKDAIVFQVLARYYYLKECDYDKAKFWALKASKLGKDNSYIADTYAQVIKHELRHATDSNPDGPINPDKLKDYLGLADSASKAFKRTQAIANKEVALRSQIIKDLSPYNSGRDDLRSKGQKRKDYAPYNCSGCVGEIQVAVMVIEMLGKIPVFQGRQDLLSHFLSGQISIQDIQRKDPLTHNHDEYYNVLTSLKTFLEEIKNNMKRQFDFLDRFFINLSPFFSQTDVKEDRLRSDLRMSFITYTGLFCTHCETASKEVNCRQALEMYKADTYFGILDYLSGVNTDCLDKIVQNHVCLYTNKSKTSQFKDVINYIFASVVHACMLPRSAHIVPYAEVVKALEFALANQVQHEDPLAVHFIASVLLWPEHHPSFPYDLSGKLGIYLTQLRNAFTNEMKSMVHGKRPAVHFYLGKDTSTRYSRLVSHRRISEGWSSEHFNNGQIWRDEKITSSLQRVHGVVQRNYILADTSNPRIKVEVMPQYQCHLVGKAQKAVSFYIGFTMKGPVAYDIQ